jgi:hypothetical protein
LIVEDADLACDSVHGNQQLKRRCLMKRIAILVLVLLTCLVSAKWAQQSTGKESAQKGKTVYYDTFKHEWLDPAGIPHSQRDRHCYPPPKGMSGWWTGDGNTADIVAGRNALLRGNATTGPGLVDEAFVLDGAGDFIEVPHDPALNFGTVDFTVDLWAYFNNTDGEQVLIEKWVQGNPMLGWTLTKLDGNILRLAMASGDGSETDVDSGVLSIPTGTWTHFAVTRKGGNVTVFMNAVPVAVGASPLDLDSNSSLKFGHRGSPIDTPGSEDDRGFFLNGRIDEVELFVGRALPHGLIQAIVNAGSAGKCKRAYGDLAGEED